MRKTIAACCLTSALTACAVTGAIFGSTPEAQVKTGADLITAAAKLGTDLLRRDRTTVTQAKGYRAILGTADEHLKNADRALLDCRRKTESTTKTNPDPCKASVEDDIALSISVAGSVHKTLKAKE